MKNVQIGESLTGDLSEGTWTFEVQDLELIPGEFAIVKKEDFNDLLTALKESNAWIEKIQEITVGTELEEVFKHGVEKNNSIINNYEKSKLH